jgi:aquaporin Z
LGYIVAQVIGGIVGAVILFAIATNLLGGDLLVSSGFATNRLATGVSMMSGAVIEVVMTMILCLVVLATTRSTWPSASTPIAVGVALTLVHVISIPLTNTSVNPARSIGVALVSHQNIAELGLFIIAPILGAVLAYFLHVFVLGREHHMHNA